MLSNNLRAPIRDIMKKLSAPFIERDIVDMAPVEKDVETTIHSLVRSY